MWRNLEARFHRLAAQKVNVVRPGFGLNSWADIYSLGVEMAAVLNFSIASIPELPRSQ
jgi:hypothetical protein